MTVKTLLIDEKTNAKLNDILTRKLQDADSTTSSGLIIGNIDLSSGVNRDLITDIIETPFNDEQGSNEAVDKGSVVSNWIVNHALQIHDMLVGGVDILGIYCIDYQQTQAKQLLSQIFKALNNFDYYKQMDFNSDRLLFTIDTAKKSVNMRSMSLGDSTNIKSSKSATQGAAVFQQCELKVVSSLLKTNFVKINSNLTLNSTFKTPNIKSYDLLKEDFYKALNVEEMFDEKKYVCLLNDVYINDDPSQFSENKIVDLLKLMKDRSMPVKTGIEFGNDLVEISATLMENLTHQALSKKANEASFKITNKDSLYDLNGVCNLTLLANKELSIGKIKRMLVYDLMRSLYARVRLLIEDLDAPKEIIGDVPLDDDPNSTDGSSTEESYQTPNRIHIYLENNFIISDYVFPDETFTDICTRIKQLFNYDMASEKQIYYAENLPTEIRANILGTESDSQKKGSSRSSSCGSLSPSGRLEQHKGDGRQLSGQRVKGTQESQKAAYYLSALVIGIFAIIMMYFSFKAASYSTYDSD